MTLPLVWMLGAWDPFGPPPCRLCPGVEPRYDALFRAIVLSGCVQLVAVGIYLVASVPRAIAAPGAILRWFPASIAVVALALGAFVPGSFSRNGDWLYLLFLVWLVAPLIFYAVHRADPRSVVPVLLGLVPAGVISAILAADHVAAGMPAAILLATGIFVGVRRATS